MSNPPTSCPLTPDATIPTEENRAHRAMIVRIVEGYKRHITTRFHRLIGIRIANIPDDARDICERFGEQTVSAFLAGGFQPTAEDLKYLNATEERKRHARDWITEHMEIREFRDWWIPTRDLILEIIVIVLIGREIVLSNRQDQHQNENFTKQQSVLSSMQQSAGATATTLTALKTTTEAMNKSVERNAAAAEASSQTAEKSLVVSERAYVSTAITGEDPKEAEKLRATISVLNSGKTPAIDFEAKSATGISSSATPLEDVRKLALALKMDEAAKSQTILGPGQTVQQSTESNATVGSKELAAIKDGTMVWYVFVFARYNDTFNRHHVTETCTRYDPNRKLMLLCSHFNKAD